MFLRADPIIHNVDRRACKRQCRNPLLTTIRRARADEHPPFMALIPRAELNRPREGDFSRSGQHAEMVPGVFRADDFRAGDVEGEFGLHACVGGSAEEAQDAGPMLLGGFLLVGFGGCFSSGGFLRGFVDCGVELFLGVVQGAKV